jgi:thiosulfate/3-mercaptopyruvate sulfurtransferase
MIAITTRSEQVSVREYSPSIVEPQWVQPQLGNASLRILDVRDRHEYDAGHLPGAIWFDRTALSVTRSDLSVTLVPAALFATLMGQLGIGTETAVVVYDDVWSMHAARIVWALYRFGHRQAAVLSGGAEGWRAAGFALTRGRTLAFPQRFVPLADDAQRADLGWLQARRGDRAVLLIDVRGAHEYAAGHLPGAQHWEWSSSTPLSGFATMRPADELSTQLAQQRITPERRIVIYCGSGMRAAHTYLVLKSLGYPDVRVLDDAWRGAFFEAPRLF